MKRSDGWDEPDILAPFPDYDYDPYVPATPVDVGTIHTDVLSDYGVEGLVEFSVLGSDPWLSAPLATLMTAAGDPVLMGNTNPITSDGQAFVVNLTMEPRYKDDKEATTRTFIWTFSLPIQHRVVGAVPSLSGSYVIHVEIPNSDGTTTEVDSSSFAVQ